MKKIKVCADPFPPYQYIDKDGEVKGRDYEIVIKKLQLAGYDPEMCIAPWNQIYKEFEHGEQDVLFQAQDSPERLEKFYFSKLLRYAVTEIVTANVELVNLKTYEDLTNYKIGVIADFANGPEIDGLPSSCKVEFADTKEILQAVSRRKVDVGVCDQGVKEYLMTKEQVLYPIKELTYQRPLYVMFHNQKQRDDFDAV